MRRTGISVGAVGVMVAAVGLVVMACWASPKEPERPRITRLAGVEIVSSNLPAAESLYEQIFSLDSACRMCQKSFSGRVFMASAQWVHFTQMPATPPATLLTKVNFPIDDASVMKRWLKFKQVPFKEIPSEFPFSPPTLSVLDPEGHELRFVSGIRLDKQNSNVIFKPVGPVKITQAHMHMIHVGFVVRHREAMDKFYKDVLGFHVYWHGGDEGRGDGLGGYAGAGWDGLD